MTALSGDALLAFLGGDTELAQGFLFMPHAFLGCDWTGHVHVTVAHERGVHHLTLAVRPGRGTPSSCLSSTRRAPLLIHSSSPVSCSQRSQPRPLLIHR